jgi:hypothetical protein
MKQQNYKSEYDNYEIIINKLSGLLKENNLILIENTRKNGNFDSNKKKIERVLGNMKCSELRKYSELLEMLLKIE